MAEFFFRAFGTPGIDGPNGPLGAPATQRRTIALLAIVSAAGSAGVRREKLLELLWPDSDPERARHALTQALYQARRSVGGELFVTSGDYIQLDSGTISSDVAAFEDALARHDTERLLAVYTGPFLEGFILSSSAEFERWVSSQRAHFAEQTGRAVDAAAARAEANQDWPRAVWWLKRLSALEPIRGSVAVRLMSAMAASGDRAGAIRHAQIHAAIVAAELDAPPDTAVRELEEQLRMSNPAVADPVLPSQEPTLVPPSGERVPSSYIVAPAGEPPASSTIVDYPREAADAMPVVRRNDAPLTGGRRRHISLVWWALLATSTLLLAVAGWRMTRRASPEVLAPRSDVLVVLPFRVTGGGEAASYLSEGLMDLLITTLPDVTPAMAVDPGALVRVWREAGGTPTTGLSLPKTLQIARTFRSTHLVGGTVIVAGKRLVVTGWLADVATGRINAQTTVEGTADSLTMLVNRLGARLVAVSAGQPALLADRAMGSAKHVRTYLAGLRAYRAGQFAIAGRRFASVLTGDTSFAEAAFWLMLAGDRGHVQSQRARGLRLAWAARDALSEADRAYLIAFAGPRYPRPSSDREHLQAWESVVRNWPDRADAWQELGEILFHDGAMLGIQNTRERARRAFMRARLLAPDFALPIPYLVQIATLDRNRAVLDSLAPIVAADSSDLGEFARWQLAMARGDSMALRRLRASFARIPLPSLREIAMAAQYEELDSADVLSPAVMLVRRTVNPDAHMDALLGLHSAALLWNRLPLVRQTLEEIDDADPVTEQRAQRLQVTDALYGAGDSTEAMLAVPRLRHRDVPLIPNGIAAPTLSALRAARRTALDRCVAAQWDLLHDSSHLTDTPRRALTTLRAVVSATGDDAIFACRVLVEAVSSVRRGRCQTATLAPLDRLLRDGVPAGEIRPYLSVVTSSLYRACGDSAAATATARMHSYMEDWPMYRSARAPSG